MAGVKAKGDDMDAERPVDVPAGGLDVGAPPHSVDPEAFPGESQLTEEERKRWLILHFAVPRTIMTWDLEQGRSTEAELNDVLSGMAWGTIDAETRDFILESEDPSLEAPHASLISYAEFVARTYPTDPSTAEKAREENQRMASERRATFTNPGNPGSKFRPMFDLLVKNLAHSNKALMRAFDLKKPILNEADMPEDSSKLESQNIMRFGRHQILPSFWHLLCQLTRSQRRFSVVFHSFSREQLALVQGELALFCQGQHPAYSGQNKTHKPPLMSGEKGSRDYRLSDANIGFVDRWKGQLEFRQRADEAPAEPKAPMDQPAEGELGLLQPEAPRVPAVYAFPPYHEAYAGLEHHILSHANTANTAAIVDDWSFWNSQDRAAHAGKLFPVDRGLDLAETKVQHIFFDGHIQAKSAHCVDVRDVVTGASLPLEDVSGPFLHRVNFVEAITDPEYFVNALSSCELKFSQKLLEGRRPAVAAASKVSPEVLRTLPPKEYLYRSVIPALLPALEACQRDRPADPIEFIAFYMLRHKGEYFKTLKS
eukprot:CAMPEP_0170597166 /NCGR_PEP_ID=MMETSP0224-20130122/15559_1 /TAXON_ID=285029 /ORGANISM="Togula jolla, Strain CCCM 725" /LENGTH=539 /DNA_ID=CAMNT_0010921613 /DNA_START=19 /DNA_END=1638 /DNA_ORIENTATION=+